jgi:hypothetical protein
VQTFFIFAKPHQIFRSTHLSEKKLRLLSEFRSESGFTRTCFTTDVKGRFTLQTEDRIRSRNTKVFHKLTGNLCFLNEASAYF